MIFKKNIKKINNRKVFYWEKKNKQKSFVVFLHGFPGSHKGLTDVAKKIGDYHFLIPDLPACGFSEPLEKKHSLKNYAEWLNNFLESFSIKDKVIIVGHSFGARVALTFGVYYPDKVEKLILITPVVKTDSLIDKLGCLSYELAKILPGRAQGAWLHNIIYRDVRNAIIYKSSSSKRRKHLISVNDKESERANDRANIEVFNELYKSKPISKGKKIKIKTLLIACDTDAVATLSSIKELYKRFTNADISVMKKSGHLVVLERPAAVASVVRKWLKYKS